MKKLAYIMLAFFCLVLRVSEAAPTFSNIFIFGDSASDIGNSHGAPYTNSPGITWSPVVAKHYGLKMTPSGAKDDKGGNNWAHSRDTTHSLVKRVNTFLSLYPTLSDTDLIIIWLGFHDVMNDFVNRWPNSKPLQTVVDNAETNFHTALISLTLAGAQNIVVMAVPRPDLMPEGKLMVQQYGPEIIPAVKDLVAKINQVLQNEVEKLKGFALYYDTNQSLLEVHTNYKDYGFTNTTDFYTGCPVECNVDEYLFWDRYHPTSVAHELLGKSVYEFIDLNIPN